MIRDQTFKELKIKFYILLVVFVLVLESLIRLLKIVRFSMMMLLLLKQLPDFVVTTVYTTLYL